MAIRSFTDLNVYKLLYEACLLVHKEILPKLPANEKYDLRDQMSRASKSPLALLAEGFAKRHHKAEWLNYINRCIGECNEMIVHLSLTKDLYGGKVNPKVCDKAIEMYDIGGKQLFSLGKNWKPKK